MPREYIYIYVFREMNVIGVMEPVQGCPLLASSPGRLWDTFSKRCPNFFRGWGFFWKDLAGRHQNLLSVASQRCRTSWCMVRGCKRAAGLVLLTGLPMANPSEVPEAAHRKHARWQGKCIRGFFSSSFASSASPNHAIPSKTGFLAANPS